MNQPAEAAKLLHTVQERDIRFVNLEFTDVVGMAEVASPSPPSSFADCARRRQVVRRLGHRGLRARGRDRHVSCGPTSPPSPRCPGARRRGESDIASRGRSHA